MWVEIPLIDAISSKYSPPKDNKLHNSKPTCSSRLCHFSASQLEWSFLLHCLLLKPRAWLPGCRPTGLDDPESVAATRERNQAQVVNVILCLCAEVHISKGEACTILGWQSWRLPVVVQWLNLQACVVHWIIAGFSTRPKRLDQSVKPHSRRERPAPSVF